VGCRCGRWLTCRWQWKWFSLAWRHIRIKRVMFASVAASMTGEIARYLCFFFRSTVQALFLGEQNCEKRLLAESCLPVCPHGTTRLPLDSWSWNLISIHFSKIWRENSSFIKTEQE
jgi:hypothetical protein